GRTVAGGTAVMISYGAGNVDPAAYPDPFEGRFDRAENPHLAFGAGVHRCLGSPLAPPGPRLTLPEWGPPVPDYPVKPGHEELHYPPGLRHVRDLMLCW